MTQKKIIIFSGFIVLLAQCFLKPVYAAGGVPIAYRLLSAEGTWTAVEEINERADLRFCSVHKNYENGHSLYISQSMQALSATFILPNQDIVKNELYSVKLGTDELTLVDTEIKVSMEKIIKVRMEPHTLQRIRSADNLRLAVNSFGYSFPVKDWSRASGMLGACRERKGAMKAYRSRSGTEGHHEAHKEEETEAMRMEAEEIASRVKLGQVPLRQASSVYKSTAVTQNNVGISEQNKEEVSDPNKESAYDASEAMKQRQSMEGLSLSAHSDPLATDERELFESLKTKLFLLEREKEAARKKLTDIRQKEIEVMKVDIGNLQKIERQAAKIRLLEKKLKEFGYAGVQNKSQDSNSPVSSEKNNPDAISEARVAETGNGSKENGELESVRDK